MVLHPKCQGTYRCNPKSSDWNSTKTGLAWQEFSVHRSLHLGSKMTTSRPSTLHISWFYEHAQCTHVHQPSWMARAVEKRPSLTWQPKSIDKTNDQETNLFHIFKPSSWHLGRNFSLNRLQMLPNQIRSQLPCQFLDPAQGTKSQMWVHRNLPMSSRLVGKTQKVLDLTPRNYRSIWPRGLVSSLLSGRCFADF